MLRHVEADLDLRDISVPFNIMLRVLPDDPDLLGFDLRNEIFRYRTGVESVLVKPFCSEKAWKNDKVHNHTVLVLLLSPDRRNGMRLTTGDELTILGCTKRDCYQHSSGCEIMFLEAKPLPSCIVVKHPRNSHSRLVFDAYSGFGGWHKGGQIVGAPYKVFWEIDPEIAALCSRNTGTHVLQTNEILKMSHETFRHHLSMGITIQGDFGEMAVWEYLCQSGIEWASFSLPCPSWSRLGFERGLDDPRGSEHHSLLFFARYAQPLVLVLENVDALLSHRHWIDLRAMFVELGFQIVHVGSDSLHKVMPMSRSRACIILANRAYASEFRTFDLGVTDFPPLGYMMNPRACGYIHETIPDELGPILKISQSDRAILADKRVWPYDWEYQGNKGQTIPLKSRVHPKSQILPCAVAKYASPGDIAKSLLENKGLFMKIMQQAETNGDNWYFRWISPFEQLASMGFPCGTMLPKDKKLAYHVVGNSIAVAHSIISLLRVKTMLPDSFLTTGKNDLFDALVEMRLRVGKLPCQDLQWDDDYMWLCPKSVIPATVTVPPTICHETQCDDRQNSPDTQLEVDAIARLLQAEENHDRVQTFHSVRIKTVVPDAPFLFVPNDQTSSCAGEITYQCKSLAICVPQLAFNTIERDTVAREITCETMIEHDLPQAKVHLRTLDGTWSWKGSTSVPSVSISLLIRDALPHAKASLFDRFIFQGKECHWEHLIDLRSTRDIQIAFQPRYVARLIQSRDAQHMYPILCDVCDTPSSVAKCVLEHYHEITHDVSLAQADQFLHKDDYILAQPAVVFQIQTENRHDESKVAVIHPLSGKFHELIVPKQCTIRDILFSIAPELCEHESVAAECNHQRISLNIKVQDIDTTKVIRLRCFPLIGGGKGDIRNQLREQLLSHGVPENIVSSRIHMICSAVPDTKLGECFQQADVWGALKNICTAASVRLVQPQELKDRQMLMRQSTGKGTQRANPKGQGKVKQTFDSSKHSPLLPPMVENVEFVQDFQGQDGTSIPVIYPSAFCTNGTGVCPMNLQQAKSFLPVSTISPDPLAILVLGHHEALSNHHITVAGTLKATGIPCLLPATLIQFGDTKVEYKFTGLKVAVSPTESHILEVVINKDKNSHWDSNATPIDIVAKSIPAVKEKSVLIGTWGWKSLDNNWKPTHASTAQVWKGHIRIASTALDQMLKASGPEGISLWPKDNDYKADPAYVHLAINADSVTQAQACAQKVPQHLGFVSHRGRFLIRCLRINFNAVKKTLNPEGCILDACEINPTDLRFVLTGLTEGYTAQSITDGLKNAGWNARTVRALSAKTWLLVADKAPAATHLEFNGTLATIRPFQKDAPGRQFDIQTRPHQAMSLSSWNDDRSTVSAASSFGQGPIATKLDEITAKLHETTEQIGTLTEQMQFMTERQEAHEQQVAEQFEEVEQQQQQMHTNLEGSIVQQMKSMFSSFEGNLATRLDRIEHELAEDGDKRRKTS